jgi:flavin reductase (DIM6/NTAB) family NADH-FMN oxidoreductase RutF
MSSTAQSISAQDFRAALGAFATGVTVVTTSGEEHSYGMTANAFSSVSLDPPLILVCVKWPSEGAEHIERNGVFAVNILSAHQEPLSRYFASRDRPRGRDAFRDIPSRVVASGSPVIEDVLAYMDCALHATHEAGDHRIYIGQVLALESAAEKPPLLFHGGGYRLLADG